MLKKTVVHKRTKINKTLTIMRIKIEPKYFNK